MTHRLPLLGLLLLTLTGTGCAQSSADSLSWRAVDALIERDYPGVPTLSTDRLAAWLADSTRPAPLLLDAREVEEYAVSHLPGALRVDPDAPADVLAAEVDPGRPVVVYCSVGYRSARVTEALRAAGVEEVQNLEGSIFRWANEGRPVVRGDEAVRTVHPYDAVWGRLLRPELHPD